MIINKKKNISIDDFHIPRWNELPSVDLYLLKSVLLSCSYKIYVQNTTFNKQI